MFEEGIKFLKSIKPGERVALIYHKDVDGIASGSLMKAGLKRMGIDIAISMHGSYRSMPQILECIGSKGIDKIIVVDIGAGSRLFAQTPFGERLKAAGKVLIIDHHMIKDYEKNGGVILINPRFENPEAYQPASYIVYKFLSRIVDMRDKEWLAVLGTIADYAFEDCKDLLDKWINVKSRDELFEKTEFGKAAFMVSAALFEIGIEEVMDMLDNAKSLEGLTGKKELKDAYARYEKVYKEEVKAFWKKSEVAGKVIFSVVKPKYEGMGSPIVSEAGRKNKDKVIILFEDMGDKYNIDARYQGEDIDMGKLMAKTCGGGGHRNAAGGLIDKTDLEGFKSRLLKALASPE